MSYRVRFADGREFRDLEIVPAMEICADRYPGCVIEELDQSLWMLVFRNEDDSVGTIAEKLAAAIGEIIPCESVN